VVEEENRIRISNLKSEISKLNCRLKSQIREQVSAVSNLKFEISSLRFENLSTQNPIELTLSLPPARLHARGNTRSRGTLDAPVSFHGSAGTRRAGAGSDGRGPGGDFVWL
jgi:hypothetical protein